VIKGNLHFNEKRCKKKKKIYI